MEENEKALKQTAKQFVTSVDKNDGEALQEVLHPKAMQYTQLGAQLIPSSGEDFTKMVVAKKLGGVPRKITFKSAEIVRGSTATVVLNAVSSEYDFMYQLSMVKAEERWLIVSILTDINKVGG